MWWTFRVSRLNAMFLYLLHSFHPANDRSLSLTCVCHMNIMLWAVRAGSGWAVLSSPCLVVGGGRLTPTRRRISLCFQSHSLTSFVWIVIICTPIGIYLLLKLSRHHGLPHGHSAQTVMVWSSLCICFLSLRHENILSRHVWVLCVRACAKRIFSVMFVFVGAHHHLIKAPP